MYFGKHCRVFSWLTVFILMCVPHLPIMSYRCQYQAYAAAAEGRNITMFAITVRPIDGTANLKALLDLSEEEIADEATQTEDEEEPPPPDGEETPFAAKDSQGNDLPPPLPPGETIDTTACLTPKSPEPPELQEGEVPELEPCPLGEEGTLPCDETPNEAYNAVTPVLENTDGDCGPSPEEETMVMAECRSCTARLNPNGGGVKLTCYDCQHQRGDKTCHVGQTDPTFRVQAKFFEVAGFGLTNATSLG